MIQSREVYKENETRIRYAHFVQRLEERYGLTVSYDEWLTMCSTHPITIIERDKTVSNRQYTGFINYKGVTVVVIKRGNKGTHYVTALPIDYKKYVDFINKDK